MPTAKACPAIYQLKITLLDITRPIWRRVQVPSTIRHPGDGIVRDAATLVRPRQFSQRGIDSELKELTNTQRDGVTIYVVGNSDGTVTHAIGGLQENGRVKHLPFLRATRPPEVLQDFPLRRRQDQGLSLRDEWHKPFCHGNVFIG
jgi:hypothetical protein